MGAGAWGLAPWCAVPYLQLVCDDGDVRPAVRRVRHRQHAHDDDDGVVNGAVRGTGHGVNGGGELCEAQVRQQGEGGEVDACADGAQNSDA